MADFSDLLWNDSGSGTLKPAATTLGNGLVNKPSTTSQTPNHVVRPYDTFSVLASTASGSRSVYSRTNSGTVDEVGYTTQSPKPSTTPNPAPPNSSSVDAFGSLFSSGPGAASASNLSIAQQQARLAQQKQATPPPSDHGAFWDHLESGGRASPVGSAPTAPLAALNTTSAFPTPSFVPSSLLQPSILQSTSRPGSAASAQKTTNNSPLSTDPWGDFDTLASADITVKASIPSRVAQQTKPAVDDLFDFSEFERQPPPTTDQIKSSSPRVSRPSSPGDFKFGNREYDGDDLLNGNNSDEDDILGDLAKPVDQIPSGIASRASNLDGNNESDSNHRTPISRAVSPPPHIIGQIVEMGFSVQQARIALAATDTGLDVEVALDTLLNNVSAENANASAADFDGGRRRLSEEEAWERREEQRQRQRRQRQDGARATSSPSSSARPRLSSRRQQTVNRDRLSAVDGDPQASASDAAAQFRDHADNYLSQAGEIGLNMLKSANSFWFSSKAQLQKAYEERRAAAAAATASNAGSVVNGTSPSTSMRPRWAQGDVEDDDMEDDMATPRPAGGFRDDDADAEEANHPESVLPAPPPMPKRPSSSKQRQLEIDLFAQLAEERSGPYQSPHRRRHAATRERDLLSRSSQPTAASSSRASSSRAQAERSLTASRSPSPLYKRTLVTTSPSILAQSTSHRTQGTEMFKLGRFAEAEAAYGNAIAVLPKGHLVLVPLLNNRAAARLKTGQYKGAVEDCSTVLDMIEPHSGDTTPTNKGIGRRYHPSREEPLPPVEDGEAVNLAEGYIKALQRRAQAYESGEKWALARTDWERLVGVDWPAGLRMREEAVRGIGRCRQMLSGDGPAGAGATLATPKPSASVPPSAKVKVRRPTQPPADSITVINSSGVAKLRAQADAQEAEDGERIRIKDSVDVRLIAWKGGKEGNLRALIASLDTVLWPELGWAKVGMHELVTPAQVKVRYMKAIGRVHPDKLSAMNTTVEQKMIANGVFGALNEAWNTFMP